jgi:hypothetical protein
LSQGEEDWLRFFCLMGSAIAAKENGQLVPGTPGNEGELKGELKHYFKMLEVEEHLHTYGAVLKTFENEALAGAH